LLVFHAGVTGTTPTSLAKLSEVAVPDKIQELSRIEDLRDCIVGYLMTRPGVARISPGNLDLRAKEVPAGWPRLTGHRSWASRYQGGGFLPPTLPIVLAPDRPTLL
jgi:hypothetical protein